MALRKQFELYANFRPIRNLPHIPTRYPDVDLIIVRENTESLYSGIEHEVVPGVVESLKIITEKASTRIARFAFEYARKNKRKKIHAIHKANIMKLSDGLFLRCCPQRGQGLSRDHLRRAHRGQHLHAAGDESVSVRRAGDGKSLRRHHFRPVRGVCRRTWDSFPAPILAMHCAIFEAVHGSAPDIAGKNMANPTALLRSALLMLRHLGEHDAALKIRNALEKVYRTRDKLTRDVGGKAGTSEFADFIIEAMANDNGVHPSSRRAHQSEFMKPISQTPDFLDKSGMVPDGCSFSCCCSHRPRLQSHSPGHGQSATGNVPLRPQHSGGSRKRKAAFRLRTGATQRLYQLTHFVQRHLRPVSDSSALRPHGRNSRPVADRLGDGPEHSASGVGTGGHKGDDGASAGGLRLRYPHQAGRRHETAGRRCGGGCQGHREGVVYKNGGVKVTAFLVDHGEIKPAFGYRVDYGGHSVTLSGDTRPSENLIKFAQGTDVLIHEVIDPEAFVSTDSPQQRTQIIEHHTTPEQAGIVFLA